MGKYIKTFIGIIIASFIFFVIFGEGLFRVQGGHTLEGPLLGIGTIIILLLSYLIAQIQYLIDLIKKQ